jgi:hypothetical protein
MVKVLRSARLHDRRTEQAMKHSWEYYSGTKIVEFVVENPRAGRRCPVRLRGGEFRATAIVPSLDLQWLYTSRVLMLAALTMPPEVARAL